MLNFFSRLRWAPWFHDLPWVSRWTERTLISQTVIEHRPGCDLTLTHSRKTNGSVHNLAPCVQSCPSSLLDRSFKCSEDPLRQQHNRRPQQHLHCTSTHASTCRVAFLSIFFHSIILWTNWTQVYLSSSKHKPYPPFHSAPPKKEKKTNNLVRVRIILLFLISMAHVLSYSNSGLQAWAGYL